jgi:GDP-L-fucose synthase
MRILITGGSSMVAQHLKELLPPGYDNVYVNSKKCDLTDLNAVRWMISSYEPDHVVHLAARVGGIQDNINRPAEYFDDNILMNTNIVKACHEYKIKRFTGILSTCIYPDKLKRYPMLEEDMFKGPPTPTNLSYGYAKRAMAVQIDAYNKQYGTKYNYLIPCNLYSEYDNFHNESKMHFVTALLKKIKISKPIADLTIIKLLGTGKPLRQFMYAGDFARVIKEVIDKKITESFNVAFPINYTIDQLAHKTLGTLKENYYIEYSKPELDGQYRKDVDITKMLKIFPNFKFTGFEQGIKKVYDKIS